MYCYTYANSFTCIFNELQMWSNISSEHPVFFKTVASLSNVPLPQDAVNKLTEFHKLFNSLYNRALSMKKIVDNSPYQYYQHTIAVKKLISDFLYYDNQVLSFYPNLKSYGSTNKAWQELVAHIIHEQTFMYELFKDLIRQIR